MFKYISEILKSFTPAQRITALLILVATIVMISLGPTLIKENTNDCTELEARVKSQQTQILELSARVEELNRQVISGQQECTDNLIQKQKEIMSIVNGMIDETQRGYTRKALSRPNRVEYEGEGSSGNPDEPRVAYSRMEAPEPVGPPAEEQTLEKLKKLRSQIQTQMKKPANGK